MRNNHNLQHYLEHFDGTIYGVTPLKLEQKKEKIQTTFEIIGTILLDPQCRHMSQDFQQWTDLER